MRQQTYNVFTYREFDKLVQEHFGVPGYRCVAENEWHNDSDYTFEDIDGEVDEWGEKDLVAKEFGWRTHLLLNDLVRRNILTSGNYLIEVCW